MQDYIATLTPAENREQAIGAARNIFDGLTSGGDNPVYDSYTLFNECPDPTGPGNRVAAHRYDSPKGESAVTMLWDATRTDIGVLMLAHPEEENNTVTNEESEDPPFAEIGPRPIELARSYHLYDDNGRPIMTQEHLISLSTAIENEPGDEELWVIKAFVNY